MTQTMIHLKDLKIFLLVLVLAGTWFVPKPSVPAAFLEENSSFRQNDANDDGTSSATAIRSTTTTTVTQFANNNHHHNAITPQTNHSNNEYFESWWKDDLDCTKPLPKPILGVHDLSRIVNVGMPKCGSNSINAFFLPLYGASKTRHYNCGKRGYCGSCIQEAIKSGKKPLTTCGNFTVFSQMDRMTGNACIFPQVLYLEELYHDSPTATWLLPMRNVTAWYNSLTAWTAHGRATRMRNRFVQCKRLTALKFTAAMGKHETDYATLMCNHVRRIRQFVKNHPTLSLIEFNIEDADVGEYLASLFPGTRSSHWGQANVQKKLHQNGNTNANAKI